MSAKNNNQFIASVHRDYLPFIKLATDEELAQFIRAQISQADGEEIPELTGMAKALFDTHLALIERLEESSRKKSEAGELGGAPRGNQNAKKQPKTTENNRKQTEVENDEQCLNKNKPISITNTIKEKEIKDLPPKAAATDCQNLGESPHEEASELNLEPIEPQEKTKAPEITKKSQGYTPAFEQFWKIYPQRNGKKGSKDQAFECWNRQLQGKYVKNGAGPPTERQLTAAVKAYADFCAQTTQYPQDARTWLGPGNHWREFMSNADMPNAPPEFDLYAYCTNADGEIDLKKLARTQRAMEGDEYYAEYLPECFRLPTQLHKACQ